MKTNIVVTNSKGGTGKTTVSLFLAEYYKTIKNKKVLLIDLDYQQVNGCQYFANQNELINMGSRTLFWIIDFIISNTSDLNKDNVQKKMLLKKRILESLIPKNEDDYSFATIASNIYIKDIQYKLWNEPTKINYIFKILKKVLYESFDVIIVDTPPDISFPLVQSAYEGMNNFLIVTDVGEFGMVGVSKVLERFESTMNEDMNLIGILVNKFQKTSYHQDFFEALKELYPTYVISQPLPIYIDYQESVFKREFILNTNYIPKSIKSKQQIKMILDEIDERVKWEEFHVEEE